MVVMKGPGNLPDNWKCMKNQLDVIASHTKDLFERKRCNVSNKKKQTNVIKKNKLPAGTVTGVQGMGFPAGICELKYPGQIWGVGAILIILCLPMFVSYAFKLSILAHLKA
jgi:hypothetical protein